MAAWPWERPGLGSGKGGNSPRQLCKIYWLSTVPPPACNFYLGRSSDIANYALASSVSPIKQHFMSLLFSRASFLMSLFKLFHFMDLTKGMTFCCLNPNFDLMPLSLPDYDRGWITIYDRSQIRFALIVLCDSLNRETAPTLWILPAFIPRRRSHSFSQRDFPFAFTFIKGCLSFPGSQWFGQ